MRRFVALSRISLISSSGVASRRANTPCSVYAWARLPTCAAGSIARVSSGAPARTPSRCAVCAAQACTSQPGRSVGVDHTSAGKDSSNRVKLSIDSHQTST